MKQIKFIFRADSTNCGDWWCPPFRYFPFRPGVAGDIFDSEFKVENSDTVILGGGGIGSPTFETHLDRIKKSKPDITIVWGAGVDTKSKRNEVLKSGDYDLWGNYFDFADEIGMRVHSNPQRFNYVPCVSCMSNLFFKYRERKPTHKIGVYTHKDVPLMTRDNPNRLPVEDNRGIDLESKIKFLSSCEYVITNTYHGVYWATLLERKVICIPYKTGLFSFKHPPVFSSDGGLDDELMDQAKSYEGVLEESRRLNVEYFSLLTSKYELV